MQSCFLVSNGSGSVGSFLSQRSLFKVIEERKNLSDFDINSFGVVDADKLLYIYYGSDDGDLQFRQDLSALRKLMDSAFFRVAESIFILVNADYETLSDYVRSAHKDSGVKVTLHRHVGSISYNDILNYLSDETHGKDSVSNYRTVYIKEASSGEKFRYTEVDDGIDSIMPAVTDLYSMYKSRVQIESSASTPIHEKKLEKQQYFEYFKKCYKLDGDSCLTYLVSGDSYSDFNGLVVKLNTYFGKIGERTCVVDFTYRPSSKVVDSEALYTDLVGAERTKGFSERSLIIKCTPTKSYVAPQVIDSIKSVCAKIYVCDGSDFDEMLLSLSLFYPTMKVVYVTHYREIAVTDFLASGKKVDSLFLSNAMVENQFTIDTYREDFKGVRVARYDVNSDDCDSIFEHSLGTGGSGDG